MSIKRYQQTPRDAGARDPSSPRIVARVWDISAGQGSGKGNGKGSGGGYAEGGGFSDGFGAWARKRGSCRGSGSGDFLDVLVPR